MDERHAQKSPPSARPRKARWKAWLWALTKPGSVRVSATPVSFQHVGADSTAKTAAPAKTRRPFKRHRKRRLSGSHRADPERPDGRAARPDPGLRRACPH